MQTIDREKFLHDLELLQPGLSAKEIIEQSGCFIFKNGNITTFNDDIACTLATDLNFTGAVQAKPLLELLKKIKDKVIEIDVSEKSLIIKGRRKEAAIRMQADIILPIDDINIPEKDTKWKSLTDGFCEYVGVVYQCASTDESLFALTCVHICPDYIEACDNAQLIRYDIKTKFNNPVLIRREAMMHIAHLDVNSFVETDSWVHFKNAACLIVSCRKHVDEFPTEIDNVLNVSGDKVILPDKIGAAADIAGIFSSSKDKDDAIEISLQPNRVKIKGEGHNGYYTETQKLKYDGPNLKFLISPAMLHEVTRKQSECEINKTCLKIDSGKFVYITRLDAVEDE